MAEFKKFPKITRFYEQDIIVTEKIDGTNGLIYISEYSDRIQAGSRSRWITPEDDNYGFAKWVQENKEELLKLGAGYHYGEWWGQGIQRKYGMEKKVFSLFNTSRWSDPKVRPECCDVVPVLYQGPITPEVVEEFSENLKFSPAAMKYDIHYPKPEGTMIFFSKDYTYFKCPIDK